MAGPIGVTPSGANSPPSSEMPELPVRLAVLPRTTMFRPLPRAKPACDESLASLFSISRSSESADSMPLGLNRRSLPRMTVPSAPLSTTPPSDSWCSVLVRIWLPAESWTYTPASPLRYIVLDSMRLSSEPAVRRRPASPVSRMVLPRKTFSDGGLQQHAAVAVELRVDGDAVDEVVLEDVAVGLPQEIASPRLALISLLRMVEPAAPLRNCTPSSFSLIFESVIRLPVRPLSALLNSTPATAWRRIVRSSSVLFHVAPVSSTP